MTRDAKIRKAHKSLIDGQRRQMVEQIDDYGVYDFFDDYQQLLTELYTDVKPQLDYFVDATVSYHRIKE